MICIYNYKGHTFNSESELNDFLLEKDKYLEEFGDSVFSEDYQTATKSNLLNVNRRTQEKREQWEKSKKLYMDDDVFGKMEKPFMGVNEFLEGKENSEGTLFYPEYLYYNYFRTRCFDWKDGNFNDDEKELFGFGDNPPKVDINPDLLSFKVDESWSDEQTRKEFEKVLTKEQIELIEQLETKWKNQALFGDIIHFITQKLFTTVGSGKYKDKLWLDIVDDEFSLFLAQIDSKNYDDDRKPIREKFIEKDIRAIINFAKNIRNELEKDLGELIYVPEIAAIGELSSEYKGVNKLLGRMDLIAIDKDGNAHIIDFKTSPRRYNDFNSAKKSAYNYQLATYSRILAQNNVNYNNIKMYIAPIQMEGFKRDEDGSFSFKELKQERVVDDITSNIRTSGRIISNLNEVIRVPETLSATTNNLISTVEKEMKILFPNFGKKRTEEEIKEMIEKEGGFERRNDLEKPYGFKPKGSYSKYILADTEQQLVQRVHTYYNNFQDQVVEMTQTIKNKLKQGIKDDTTDVQLPGMDPGWLENTLNKYLNSNWQVLEGDGFDSALQLGMIFLQNVHTKHVEVLTISLNYLGANASKDSKMQNLTYGLGESDVVENSNPNSKMLEATNGNIRLIETMLALNNMKFNGKMNISQIHVINPRTSKDVSGSWAPNEQLLYSFNKLLILAKKKGKTISSNNLKNNNIHFASKAELALFTLKNILNITGSTGSKVAGMTSSINALDQNIYADNKEQILLELENLAESMEEDPEIYKFIKNPKSIIDQPYATRELITAYSQVLWAISEYKGYDFLQQTKDHKGVEIGLRKGFYYQPLENPGNYASNILNTTSRVMQEVYQNVRDILSRDIAKITTAVDKLKDKEGFSKLKEYTVGNQSKLYDGIIYRDSDNDLMVKNPWSSSWPEDLSEGKREFTKMFLMEINRDRYQNKTDLDLEVMIKNNDYDFFKLPLMEASVSGRYAQGGILNNLKTRLRRMADSSYYKDKISNFLSEEEEANYKKNEEIFKMNNMMDTGNGAGRKSFISKKLAQDPNFFEVDLENILLVHKQSYVIQKEMNERMPVIKAAAFALKMLGEYQGQSFDFDYKTIEEDVKTRIKNESLVEDERLKTIVGATKDIQHIASFMALAFAPVQMTGQTAIGIVNLAKLNWVYDREIFTKEHLLKSYKIVAEDLVNFGSKPTKCEALNRLFGINDMDMGTYAKNLSTNKHGIFHIIDRYAFKMTSRTDFYNRMTIFVSQMMADGCWDAIIQNEDGTVHYDCKKDKRYAAIWNAPQDSDEYKQALSRYIVAAKQFVKEGARNEDGTLFKFDIHNVKELPLPRVYTVQEAESRKNTADILYGYYDSSKKSLFLYQYLGSLIGQMRAYWSSKKNQYFAPPNSKSVKGTHVQARNEAGELLYYAIGEDGIIKPDEFVTTKTGFPVLQWQGDYVEGIFVTLASIVSAIWQNDDKSFGGMWSTIKDNFINNPDERYRRCYITNLKIIAFDTIAALGLGLLSLGAKIIYEDLDKESKKSNEFADAFWANMVGIGYKTLNYTKLDFLFLESIFSPVIDFNPFALSYLSNAIEQLVGVITGDKNAFSAIANSCGLARQNKPIFNYLANQTELFSAA